MMRRWLLWTLLLPLFCAGFGVGARAQARAPVTGNCSSTPPLLGASVINNVAFNYSVGGFDVLSGDPVSAEGSFIVDCTGVPPGQVVRLCVGFILPSPRQMTNVKNPGSKLNYDIFVDSGHQTRFDTSVLVPADFTQSITTATFHFYGLIYGNQQAASVGDYSDTQRFRIYYKIYGSSKDLPVGCETAGSRIDTLGISLNATIKPYCSISNIQDMIFPRQTIFTGDVTEQTPAQFTVKCTTDAPYAIGLDDGLNARNGRCPSSSQRCMVSRQNPLNRIDYDLYHTTQRLSRWGATDPLAAGVGGKPRIGKYAGETITVYGKIPKPTPSPAPGDYSDTITITVNY
jgi:spore coat protein U-like protein